MTDVPEVAVPVDRPRTLARRTGAAVVPLLLSLAATSVCYVSVGATLGLFFGGVFVATLTAPPLLLAEDRLSERTMVGGGIFSGIALVWLYAVLTPYISLSNVCACAVVLAGYLVFIAGVATFLRSFRLDAALASFLTVCFALAWLTWPVWLSPWLAGHDRIVAWMVPPHPLLALNGALKHLGLWDEQRLAYRMTVLGRDVAYMPPRTVAWAAFGHCLIGTLLLLWSVKWTNQQGAKDLRCPSF